DDIKREYDVISLATLVERGDIQDVMALHRGVRRRGELAVLEKEKRGVAVAIHEIAGGVEEAERTQRRREDTSEGKRVVEDAVAVERAVEVEWEKGVRDDRTAVEIGRAASGTWVGYDHERRKDPERGDEIISRDNRLV